MGCNNSLLWLGVTALSWPETCLGLKYRQTYPLDERNETARRVTQLIVASQRDRRSDDLKMRTPDECQRRVKTDYRRRGIIHHSAVCTHLFICDSITGQESEEAKYDSR